MKRQVLILTLLLISASVYAQVIHVPGDQPTIQAGINAASDGDTVLVAENTYYENIRFMGKAITVASHYVMDGDTNHINNTIIDGSQPLYPDSAACVMFVHGEDTTSILSGFTLTGGSGVFTTGSNVRSGGGIYGWEAGAKIINNKIMYNVVESDSGGGAGLVFLGGDNYWAVIDNNTISYNTSLSDGFSAFGAGMSVLVNAVIKNNIIEHNTCINTSGMADGGGIELEIWDQGSGQHAFVYNNIVRHNTLDANTFAIGGGICSFYVPGEYRNNEIYGNGSLAGDRCIGGGLRIIGTQSKVLVEGNNIFGNTQIGNYAQGAGIDVGLADDTVTMRDNMIWGNEIFASTAAWGSGINCVKDCCLIITENHIYSNHNSGIDWWCGAGMYSETMYDYADISNNYIYNNTGTGTSYGGGIGLYNYNSDDVSIKIESNFIKGNHCNYGAGLWALNTFDIRLANNIFEDNTAWSWGGGYALRHASDDDALEVSIAHSLGEEVSYLFPKQDVHPVIVNNTFVGNSAGVAGGAINSDQQDYVPIFFNNIFWGNTAANGDNIVILVPDTIILSYCDIEMSESSIYGNYTGEGNFFEDPEFLAGDSLCHISGGPCHDTGIDKLKIDGMDYYAPFIDFDGNPRPQGEFWDVGADECLMIGIPPTIQDHAFDLSVSPNPSSGALHLRYSIPETRNLKLEVYSANGVRVKTLFNAVQKPGNYSMNFDIDDLPDGLYFIRLQAEKKVETAKLILIK